MACPAGCVRTPGHPGFHTTHPDIAKREDAGRILVPEPFAPANSFAQTLAGFTPETFRKYPNLLIGTPTQIGRPER